MSTRGNATTTMPTSTTFIKKEPGLMVVTENGTSSTATVASSSSSSSSITLNSGIINNNNNRKLNPTKIKLEPFSSSSPTSHQQQHGGTITPIKQERLSSFRLPRDLTLGGVNSNRITRPQTQNKKVYTPNLNAIRNKNADVKTSRDTTILGGRGGRGGRGKSDSGRGVNSRGAGASGRGGANSSVVQSTGLFSEGTGELKLRKSSSVFDRNSGGGGSADSASSLRRPTIVKRETKIDPEAERRNILDILGHDPDEEYNFQDCGFSNNDAFTPIALHEIKPEVKTEMDVDTTNQLINSKYPRNLNEFFMRPDPQLFLLQLPDSLPGHGPDNTNIRSVDTPSTSTDRNPVKNTSTEEYCTIRHLEEGLLGKVVRYKSGITKLVIGDTRFDLNLGMEPGLLQEIMSVNANPTERSGNLINLGQIQAKLSAIPDWENIFSTADKQSSLSSKSSSTITSKQQKLS